MPDRFAVTLGNQLYGEHWTRLDGVPTDYVRMQTYLIDTDWIIVGEKLNFNLTDMRYFWIDVDKRVTKNNPVDESDFLIYYSGHGQMINGEWQAVVKSDSANEKLQILRKAVETARTAFSKTPRVTIILDACETSFITDDYIRQVIGVNVEEDSEIKGATVKTFSNVSLTLLTPGDTVLEAGTEEAGRFTGLLLKALSDWNDDEWDWQWLESRMKQHDPSSIEILQCPPAASKDALPFKRPKRNLPLRLEKHLDYLVNESEPALALGAILGASKLGRDLSDFRIPDKILLEVPKFTAGRKLSEGFLRDSKGFASWRTLNTLALFPNLPFDRVTEVSASVSEALSMELARIILQNTKEQYKKYLKLSHFSVDTLNTTQATQVLAGYSYQIEEIHRFNSVFRVLIAYCKPNEDIGGEPIIIAFRFFRYGESDNIPERIQKRVEKEKQGVSIVSKLYGTNDEGHTVKIYLGHTVASDKTREDQRDLEQIAKTCDTRMIGTAYYITKNRKKMKTLAAVLASKFAIVDTGRIRRSTKFVLNLIEKLYKDLDAGKVDWSLGDAQTPFTRYDDEMERLQDYQNAFQEISKESFGGYENQIGKDAYIVSSFLAKWEENIETVMEFVPTGRIHGDVHQQNILLPDGVERFYPGKPVAMIDFEASRKNGYVFADIASLEVAFSVFWLADMVGMTRFLEISGEVGKGKKRIISQRLSEELSDIAFKDPRVDREVHRKKNGYKGYERVAFDVLEKFRGILDEIISEHEIFQDIENRVRRSKTEAGTIICEKTMRLLHRQYFVQLTLRAVSLVVVEEAPKAAVVEYAAWLVRQLETDSALKWEPEGDR